jgi:hypothetical protein
MEAKVLREFWVTRGLSLEQLGQPSHKEAEWLANHLEALANNLEREVSILTASVGAIAPTEVNHLELVCRDYDRSLARCEYLEAQALAYRRRAKLHRLSASTDGYRLVDNIREARQKVEYFDRILKKPPIQPEVFGIGVALAAVKLVLEGEEDINRAIDLALQEGEKDGKKEW